MIKTFRNKKHYNSALRHIAVKILLRRFLDWCREKQIRRAQSLQVAFERLPTWAKNASIILFLLVCMATFTSIIASSIKIRSPVDIQVYLIKLPRSLIKDKIRNELPVYILNTPDEQRIAKFRMYMDSLPHNSSGKIIRDSILKARPGLMDSISKLENLFHSTINNK
jgi:hypothetical protein